MTNSNRGLPQKKAVSPGMFIVLPLVFILVLSAVIGAVSVLLMWAWGLFMTPVFDLPLLSFQQAFGAIVLLLIIRFSQFSRSNVSIKR